MADFGGNTPEDVVWLLPVEQVAPRWTARSGAFGMPCAVL